MTKFVETETKSILIKRKFRDNWFWDRYVINPYRGCQFACSYCDAVTEKYLIHENYKDFSRRIYVKKNAPLVLEKEIKKYKPDVIAISGVTDPYQPAEEEYGLTRKILEVLAGHRFSVHIITKSDLVLRDIDLLKEISKHAWCTVSFTIITFNKKLLPYLEPFALPPEKRLKAVEELNKAGIQAGVNLIPIVPYLSDTSCNIEEMIKKASENAKYILIGTSMTLRSNQRIRFLKLLKKNFPELLVKYEGLYGEQENPPEDYILELNRCAFGFCKKYGIKNYIQPPNFERPFKENFEVANHLLLIAFFKEFKLKDIYSAWAYHKVAYKIEGLNKSIDDIHKRGELKKIPGVGESIAKVIEDFLVNGESEKLKDEMDSI
ncbi:TPA: radical SAM protein [bacterium]|nr:radical SAM protein [bacterium]